MFQRLLVRRTKHSDTNRPIDLGFLCEAMLFYSEVVVLADHAILRQLVDELGPDTLGALLEGDFLRLHYIPEWHAIINEKEPSVFTPSRLRHANNAATRVERQLKEKLGSTIKAERKSARIVRHIHDIPTTDLVEKGFIASVTNRARIEPAIGVILQHLLKRNSPLPQFRFDACTKGRGVHVSTDLAFDRLNAEFNKHTDPKDSVLTVPFLLSHYINSQTDSYYAARYDAEIASDPLYQKMARLDLSNTVSTRAKSEREIALFADYNFDEGRDVKAAINTGARTFDEFLPVLEEARKFRRWVANLDENACLMKEYYRAVSRQTWLDKLPGKTVRWAVFTGAGLALDSLGAGGLGTTGGVSLSALDAFYLDNLVKGWRPNQFVDHLTDFVGKS